MLLDARIIGILHAKSYEYWFSFVQVIENKVDTFETRCI